MLYYKYYYVKNKIHTRNEISCLSVSVLKIFSILYDRILSNTRQTFNSPFYFDHLIVNTATTFLNSKHICNVTKHNFVLKYTQCDEQLVVIIF